MRHTAKLHALAAHMGRVAIAHVVVTVRFTDRRHRDIANLHSTAKAIVDGLVDAGVFLDDDDTHVIGPDLRRGRKFTPP